MDMQDIITEWSQRQDARELVHAAQTILTGNQQAVRDLCNPWRVNLRENKRYRPMDTIKQELKMALTKRAKKLKMENEASDRDA